MIIVINKNKVTQTANRRTNDEQQTKIMNGKREKWYEQENAAMMLPLSAE